MRFRAPVTASLATTVAMLLLTARAEASCGDFNQDGKVSSTDALGVLGAAVHTAECANVRCDVDDSGSVGATDALLVLKSGVGQALTLTCPAVAVTSIADLPLATGPVNGGGSLAAMVAGLGGQTASGIDLGSLGPDTFGPNSSRAACEITNMVTSAVRSAAQGDKILCYVQNVFQANPDVGIDIYDGAAHTFALDFGTPPPDANPEDHGGPSSVSIRIARDESTITDFEMFACGDGPNGAQQGEYVRQTIDGPDFRMISKGLEGGGGGNYGHSVTVTGAFDDTGHFTGTKVVDVAHLFGDAYYSGFGALSFGQGSDDFSVDGYDVNSFTHPDYGTGEFAREVRAEGQLLDFNVDGQPYDIGLLAVGHGAARAHFTGSDAHGTWDDDFLEGWNGDTTLIDEVAAADFIGSVSEATLVTPAASVTIEFGEGETFDCTTPIEATVVVDQVALDAACSNLELGYEWVACHEIIPPDSGTCEGPDCPCEGPDCPAPCEGPNCPCQGPDCGGAVDCFDPTCTCDPFADDGCLEACWNYAACGEPCWDTTCTCVPEEPGCVDMCWDFPRCGEPCFGPNCGM